VDDGSRGVAESQWAGSFGSEHHRRTGQDVSLLRVRAPPQVGGAVHALAQAVPDAARHPIVGLVLGASSPSQVGKGEDGRQGGNAAHGVMVLQMAVPPAAVIHSHVKPVSGAHPACSAPAGRSAATTRLFPSQR